MDSDLFRKIELTKNQKIGIWGHFEPFFTTEIKIKWLLNF